MRNVKNAANSENTISVSGNRPRRPIVWDDVRAFLAVARHGTLTAAAGALGIGIATLSRRVDRLEDALGVPIFVRQQSGYQLTEEGSELLDRGDALERTLHVRMSSKRCDSGAAHSFSNPAAIAASR